MRMALKAAAAAIAIFVVVTLVALEGREVVVLRTQAADGTLRRTRVWVADHDGAMVVEAGNPEREFFLELVARPAIRVERGADESSVTATVLPNPDGHELIRALLSAKYGWADVWVGWIADTSRSIAVRLDARVE